MTTRPMPTTAPPSLRSLLRDLATGVNTAHRIRHGVPTPTRRG